MKRLTQTVSRPLKLTELRNKLHFEIHLLDRKRRRLPHSPKGLNPRRRELSVRISKRREMIRRIDRLIDRMQQVDLWVSEFMGLTTLRDNGVRGGRLTSRTRALYEALLLFYRYGMQLRIQGKHLSDYTSSFNGRASRNRMQFNQWLKEPGPRGDHYRELWYRFKVWVQEQKEEPAPREKRA